MLLLFTSMAWAIFFGVVGAVKGIPTNIVESAKSFGLTGFKYTRHVIIPAIVPALISGATLAWCDGWFFMIAAEYVEYMGSTYSVPGLGSYLAKAAYVYNDLNLSIILLVLITGIVLYLNFLTWHRLMERASAGTYKPTIRIGLSGVGKLGTVGSRFLHLGDHIHRPKSLILASKWLKRYTRLEKAIAIALSLVAVFSIIYFIAGRIPSVEVFQQAFADTEFANLPLYTALTLGRLAVAYVISLGIALGMGVLAAEHKRFAAIFYPIYDIGQAVPILALFPIFYIAFSRVFGGTLGLEVTAIVVLVLDMIWYMFLNVVSAVKNIPSEIKEVGHLFGLKRLKRITHLVIPAILPAIVTGSILSWGTGWNTIIFAEYMPYGKPTIYPNPAVINQTYAAVGQNFTVSIDVFDVVSLHSWQTSVIFDAHVLQCNMVSEGEFLSSIGTTLWNSGQINNTSGYIGPINSTLLKNGLGANGSGHLAYIYFTKIAPVDSEINLEETKMLDATEDIIPSSKVYSLPGLGSYLDKTGYLPPPKGNPVRLIFLLGVVATIVLLMEGLVWRRLLRKFEKYRVEV